MLRRSAAVAPDCPVLRWLTLGDVTSAQPTLQTPSPRRGRVVGFVAIGLVGVLLAVGGWVIVRSLIARDALLGALPLVRGIEASVIGGDSDVAAELTEVQQRTAEARALTSDPIWLALEVVPWVGTNLSAFREAAAVVDDVAVDALPPLAELAATLDPAALVPRDGAVALDPIIAARPALRSASDALQRADASVTDIDTAGTLPQISAAVAELGTLIAETADLVGGLETAAELLPGMLGADEPRRYLLLFLTNSEVRAGGGLPGSLAEFVVDDGRIELVAQDNAIPGFITPPEPLTDTETLLFDEVAGLFMSNVTATPQFSRTAVLAQAMWAEHTGSTVDAVVSIDVPALAAVLQATGPVPLAPGSPFGDELSGDRAVSLLLNEVYTAIPNAAAQDAFFADTARRAFEAITTSTARPEALLDALATSVDDRRLAVWSARPVEQALLEQAGLTPDLPEGDDKATAVGVFFNDSTGAKMNYYTKASVSVGIAACRADRRVTRVIEVRLTNDAPLDATTVLPTDITGDGRFGVAPSTVRTKVYVYVPRGSAVYEVRIDGESVGFLLAEHEGVPVAAVTIDLEPQQSGEVSVLTIGPVDDPGPTVVTHTPLVGDLPIVTDAALDCLEVEPVN